MANHKLSPNVKSSLHNAMKHLTQRRLAYAESAFPVTLEQMQRALVPADTLEVLRGLYRGGYRDVISKHSRFAFRLSADVLPDLNRMIGIQIDMPDELFCKGRQTHYGQALDSLPKMWFGEWSEDEKAALVKWANHALRERRLTAITHRVTDHLFEVHIDSVYAAVVRWPTTRILAKYVEGLRRWFEDEPRYPQHYELPVPLPPEMVMMLKAADAALLSADMMADPVLPQHVVSAKVVAWEKRDTDIETRNEAC